MRNVLIPTDFSIESLRLAEQALEALDDQTMTITLFHAFDISGFAPDMLGSSRRLPYGHLLTDAFRIACKRLKENYPQVLQGIHIRHMYGNNNAVFRNFIDAHDIDMIVCPDNYVFTTVTPQSINPIYLFEKSGTPLLSNLRRKRTVVYSAAPLAETAAILIN